MYSLEMVSATFSFIVRLCVVILSVCFHCSWVMLKNVHLAPQWLVQMEKRLHSLTPHSNFRLFLTMEINPRVGLLMVHSEHSTVSCDQFFLLRSL